MSDKTNKEKMIELSINNYDYLYNIKKNIKNVVDINIIKSFFLDVDSLILSIKSVIDGLLGDIFEIGLN